MIAASPLPIRVPRNITKVRGSLELERDDAGRFHVPDGWSPQWPIFGISFFDAQAYAEWKTRRARGEGLAYKFSLPTRIEWDAAAHAIGGQFTFGNHFRPKWLSSCFARPSPNPEPVMSFPIDESVMGAYDMSGSVSEWMNEWWLEDRNLRWHTGASWADGGPELIFRRDGGNGSRPESTSDSIGFRLVLRMDGGRSLDSPRPSP